MNIISCQEAFVKRNFDNIQSIKTKHPDVDFMEFASMAADIENTMQEIVEVRAKHSDDNLSLKP
ncbi:MAG: hypothetical protein O9276_21590 [Microcystis sp. LE17-20A]|jgi:hypothetical protein|uniref:hypothetical protein n=1 Tax=Microcystis sp. LE19-8.1F TaxID=3016437 RepID=UPI0022C310A8|nr:hypothetical protein [Microcystis sp. LE19-8.1F]MCZ8040619.1 hypothetical protein [Microcystis sp. LE17-20A]MCZ8212620.1 hypothetical protein [Microcystis sp. LE19-8.1F]